MSPFREAKYEAHEFFVPDVVVPFGGSECARGVANSAAFSSIIFLEEDSTKCKVRSISFQLVLAIVVGGNDFWVFGDFSNEFVQRVFAFCSPKEGYTFLGEVSERTGNGGEVRDEWSLIA